MKPEHAWRPERLAAQTLLFAILAAGTAAVVTAESPSASSPAVSPTFNLTLEEAVERALAADERLEAAVLESRRAEAAYRSARNERLPALLVTAGYDRIREIDPPTLDLPPELGGEVRFGDSITDRVYLQANLRQELFSGYRRSAQIDATEHRFQASLYHREFVASQVEMAAVELYLNAVRAAERVHVAERALERASRVREEVEHLLGEGLVTANDLLRARMAEAQTDASLARMGNGRERALLRLKRGLGIDPETVVELDHASGGQQDAPPGSGEVDREILRAETDRPDLRAIEEEVLAAGRSVRRAEAGLYPTANLVAGLRVARPSPVVFPQVAEFDHTWSVGFELTYNVGGLLLVRSRLEEARLLEEALRVERIRRAEDVALHVRSAALDIADAAEQRVAADLFVEQAEENLRTLEAMHAEGLIRFSEVIEAQELLEQAEMNRLEATIDRALAEARYRFVAGRSALP